MNLSARTLTRLSAALSGVFALGLGGAALAWKSDLALAQASDSLLDFAAAFLLAWVVVVAQTPGDEQHPMGHGRAEPLGALAIAALAGVLALEVGASAVRSLLGAAEVQLTWGLLALFLGKMAFRGVILSAARGHRGPAFSALEVDARNDLIVSAVSVAGFFGARAGLLQLDSVLAIPAALWIGWSGVELARENIDLLMGVAPPEERRRELQDLASAIVGIDDAHDLIAHSTGTSLSIHVHITVEASLTVRQGHELGERVRQRLLEEDDVSYCSVHVDPSDEHSTAPE